MKKTDHAPYVIHTIAAFHHIMALGKPEHPLVSVIPFEHIKHLPAELPASVVLNCYSIWLKKNFNGKMKYGQNEYDFDEGAMSFFSPGQVLTSSVHERLTHTGWWLLFHPDFLWRHPLAKNIKNHGYFSYAVHEALHLSEKEETMVATILQAIAQELHTGIDRFSQNVIISYIELLLNQADRFYDRQFITRKIMHHDLLSKLETLLSDYLHTKAGALGLPSVQYLSEQLHVSPNYLSDLLRAQTGQTTQQHIHDKLIEKAKEKLTTTTLSVSEIAYELGFEHSQSFSKLFKSKTDLSPVAFRQSFH